MVHKVEMPKELQVGLIAGDAFESAKYRLLTKDKGRNPDVVITESVDDFVKKAYCPKELRDDVVLKAKKYMSDFIKQYGEPPK